MFTENALELLHNHIHNGFSKLNIIILSFRFTSLIYTNFLSEQQSQKLPIITFYQEKKMAGNC